MRRREGRREGRRREGRRGREGRKKEGGEERGEEEREGRERRRRGGTKGRSGPFLQVPHTSWPCLIQLAKSSLSTVGTWLFKEMPSAPASCAFR